ncbi:hypothetical protein [Limosilactobacillus mucosae]|uniref:hypothetical protein n=1 Tax=Limosilactobacillus mucosae TaxID=97478 RepID=UPI000FFC8B0F|nr:hypothetical protein [Limosilactobacillus mucosae]RXA58125.1 hypothetical protein EQ839_02730 [Limosilactobacillus mucosae]
MIEFNAFQCLFLHLRPADYLNIATRESAIFGRVPCHDCLMLSASLIIVLPVYRMHPMADRAACR